MTSPVARAARLPLRVRLVAGFSATMLLVLAAAGGFVYWRVSFALDRQVNEDLTALSRRLAPLVTPSGPLAEAGPRWPAARDTKSSTPTAESSASARRSVPTRCWLRREPNRP